MLDFGPTAFQRSGTRSALLCSVTPTSLSSPVRAGRQNDPPTRMPGFWRWPACHDLACCPLKLSSPGALCEPAPFAYFGRGVRRRGQRQLRSGARLRETRYVIAPYGSTCSLALRSLQPERSQLKQFEQTRYGTCRSMPSPRTDATTPSPALPWSPRPRRDLPFVRFSVLVTLVPGQAAMDMCLCTVAGSSSRVSMQAARSAREIENPCGKLRSIAVR
jgi:hypothetical protein